mmetsp:Transcript_39101/g.74916  ORF Transcript_39101/g.74916 Transcript_39101/m.74916 type:complete len:303 (+) Transcript_39101:315-1223(+)|eukprot:CAMPEP_0114227476 /NCGR_PEP_ID=MMETSP0058-20121206/1812_1 /TAXON_ID=36894 /ORGANISM="Pyramimonas parkeae, CCMP726" /LENGTH=302 /DNA_ID=CAMNT_0001338323 /DNA_START=247 /DNA_END=1155 /DNA_ORIENTATION=+
MPHVSKGGTAVLPIALIKDSSRVAYAPIEGPKKMTSIARRFLLCLRGDSIDQDPTCSSSLKRIPATSTNLASVSSKNKGATLKRTSLFGNSIEVQPHVEEKQESSLSSRTSALSLERYETFAAALDIPLLSVERTGSYDLVVLRVQKIVQDSPVRHRILPTQDGSPLKALCVRAIQCAHNAEDPEARLRISSFIKWHIDMRTNQGMEEYDIHNHSAIPYDDTPPTLTEDQLVTNQPASIDSRARSPVDNTSTMHQQLAEQRNEPTKNRNFSHSLPGSMSYESCGKGITSEGNGCGQSVDLRT